jgi:hypothetical protein
MKEDLDILGSTPFSFILFSKILTPNSNNGRRKKGSHLTNARTWHALADGLLPLLPEVAHKPRPLATPALTRPLVRNSPAIL